MVEQPTPVVRAIQLIWLLVLVATVATVLAVVFADDLVANWVGGQGRSADDTRVPPSFTPVVIVLYVVVASLVLIFMSFLRGGHNWARHCLGVSMVFLGVAAISGIQTGPPVVFLVGGIVGLVLVLLALVCLYHPETSAYVARRPRARADA